MPPMRHHIRAMRRAGMSAAQLWAIIKDQTEQDAKRKGWPAALLTETLQSHWHEVKASYPRDEMDALAADIVRQELRSKSKLWHVRQRVRSLWSRFWR